MNLTNPTEQELRDRALKRIRDKQAFNAHVLAYVLANGFLISIWWVNDRDGGFWPMYPMLGWGIAVALHAWALYSGEPSEDAIQREMERLRK